MPEARVESVDVIRAFRFALLKFAEAANSALTDAESDAGHTLMWLETEQRTYWQNNVRKATELVSRCEEAVRQKKIFKDASGRQQSAVDEEKALAKAKRLKEHAEERLANVRKYAPRLHREILLYKGQVQRLATCVASDVPAAAAKLDKIVATLGAYFELQAPDSPATISVTQPSGEVGAELPSAEAGAGGDAGGDAVTQAGGDAKTQATSDAAPPAGAEAAADVKPQADGAAPHRET
jgi:hypothetical protein